MGRRKGGDIHTLYITRDFGVASYELRMRREAVGRMAVLALLPWTDFPPLTLTLTLDRCSRMLNPSSSSTEYSTVASNPHY